MDKGDISLAELIKYFDTYNRSEGKSPFILRWYRQSLTMFLDWPTETGRPVTWSQSAKTSYVSLSSISRNGVPTAVILPL